MSVSPGETITKVMLRYAEKHFLWQAARLDSSAKIALAVRFPAVLPARKPKVNVPTLGSNALRLDHENDANCHTTVAECGSLAISGRRVGLRRHRKYLKILSSGLETEKTLVISRGGE